MLLIVFCRVVSGVRCMLMCFLLIIVVIVLVILWRKCRWFFSELLYWLLCVLVWELMNWLIR